MPALVLYQILHNIRYHAFSHIGAVVCGDIKIPCHRLHLVLQDQHILCLGSHDHIRVNAMVSQPLYLWIHRSGAHASRDKQHFLIFKGIQILAHKLGRPPQGSHEIPEAVPGFQGSHLLGTGSHDLEHNGDDPCFSVIITDGQRNPLSHLIHFYNHKFPRFAGSGYPGSFYVHEVDLVCQLLCFHYLVHLIIPPGLCIPENTKVSVSWS